MAEQTAILGEDETARVHVKATERVLTAWTPHKISSPEVGEVLSTWKRS